jgi:RNAse (barnase) inhibitor barstar
MREITLDAQAWTSLDDFYESFFKAVGAPNWHGRNFNALRDSIATGKINAIELPYRIRINNYSSTNLGAKKIADDFIDLINELKESGYDVDIVATD